MNRKLLCCVALSLILSAVAVGEGRLANAEIDALVDQWLAGPDRNARSTARFKISDLLKEADEPYLVERLTQAFLDDTPIDLERLLWTANGPRSRAAVTALVYSDNAELVTEVLNIPCVRTDTQAMIHLLQRWRQEDLCKRAIYSLSYTAALTTADAEALLNLIPEMPTTETQDNLAVRLAPLVVHPEQRARLRGELRKAIVSKVSPSQQRDVLAVTLLRLEPPDEERLTAMDALYESVDALPEDSTYAMALVGLFEDAGLNGEPAVYLLDALRAKGLAKGYLLQILRQWPDGPELMPLEHLEALVHGQLLSAFDGLNDPRLVAPATFLVETGEVCRVFAPEEEAFLRSHRATFVPVLLEWLRRDGDPHAAVVLGWYREAKALPELRRWFVEAPTRYGNMESILHFYLNPRVCHRRYCYEQAIECITGKPLAEAMRLNEPEIADFRARFLAYEHMKDPDLGDPLLGLYMLWRFAPDEAHDAFREMFGRVQGTQRAALAYTAPELFPRGWSKEEMLHHLGEPDRVMEDAVIRCESEYWKEQAPDSPGDAWFYLCPAGPGGLPYRPEAYLLVFFVEGKCEFMCFREMSLDARIGMWVEPQDGQGAQTAQRPQESTGQ